MTNIVEHIGTSIKHWYLYTLAGILFIIGGVAVYQAPEESLVAVGVVFSVTFIVMGIVEIIGSISSQKSGWGWILVGGIITLALGIFLVSYPDETIEVVLPFYVAFVMMIRAINGIGFSFQLKKANQSGWFWLLLLSVLVLLFAFYILWSPAIGDAYIVVALTIGFILIGILLIVFSFKLKKIKI